MIGGHWYCPGCGALHHRLPEGLVTCNRCGNLGLRGYARPPVRVHCAEPLCTFTGWDDGGVNDDLGRHARLEHAAGDGGTA